MNDILKSEIEHHLSDVLREIDIKSLWLCYEDNNIFNDITLSEFFSDKLTEDEILAVLEYTQLELETIVKSMYYGLYLTLKGFDPDKISLEQALKETGLEIH